MMRAGNSAVGPDGIPYSIWRALRSEAVPIFLEAFKELSGLSPVPGCTSGEEVIDKYWPSFNDSIMVFLPKSASGRDVE